MVQDLNMFCVFTAVLTKLFYENRSFLVHDYIKTSQYLHVYYKLLFTFFNIQQME